MRSDVKIGLGVGALLLVIVVGYLAMHGSDNHGQPIDSAVSNNTSGNTTGESSTSAQKPVAPPVAEKTTVAQSNSAAESKPVDTTPATGAPGALANAGNAASPAGTPNNSVTISGPASAPSAAGGSPAVSPSATAGVSPTASSAAAPATPDASASSKQPNYDWNKLLNDGQGAAAADSSSAAPSRTSDSGTSTSSLYASGASTPVDSGTTLTRGATGRPSRYGGATTAPSGALSGATGKHVVKIGETLSSIAAASYGSASYWPAIQRANPGLNPNAMHAGQTITLPEISAVKTAPAAVDHAPAPSGSTLVVDPTKEYSVQPGDSLYAISMKLYGTPSKAQQIYDLNKATIGPSMSRLKVHMVLKLPAAPTTKPAG